MDDYIDHIKNLVCNFRQAVEVALMHKELLKIKPFNNFPKGCCDDTSDLLAEYLFEKGITTENVCGTYRKGGFDNKFSHAWLETKEGIIIDITLDQFNTFKNTYPKVYVGRYDYFYNNLDIDRRTVMNESYFYNKDDRLII